LPRCSPDSIGNEIDNRLLRAPCRARSRRTAQAALLPSLIILWLFGGARLSAILRRHPGLHRPALRGEALRRRRAVLTNALLFALVAAWSSPPSVPDHPVLLHAIIKVPGAYEAAHAYLDWRLLGVTSMAATFALKAFFDGIGKDARPPLVRAV
jgi:hypothetical protein